jgi:hypothetical protein
MIASIHGDVISTLGPVRYCECEVLHTASNIFIGHKTPTLTGNGPILQPAIPLVSAADV